MATLYIIRGLPGAGKSTLAKRLTLFVAEADMYFTTSTGEYQYDNQRIGDAHAYCQTLVREWMAYHQHEHVAVANVFYSRQHMQYYYDLAREFNYHVTEITLTGPLNNNIHKVPVESIERMRSKWER